MATASEPPVIVLGVRRSGTTLLRVMLDRHSRLAVPDESYFIPQLAERHGTPVHPGRFLDDLRRLPTLSEWGLSASAVRPRLREGMAVGEAIAAVYEAYAALRGKPRWGDKTPMYMQYLGLLRRLFSTARFVHLIRDGRDAATSFLGMPEGVVTRTWAHPRSAADFACQWRTEVEHARRLGERVGAGRYLEVRYEALVADPEETLDRVCAFVGLEPEAGMLGYEHDVDVSSKPHQESLRRPPTPGLRDWRAQMAPEEVRAFEDVAGDLLSALGYDLRDAARAAGPTVAARARLAHYRLRSTAWRATGRAVRRTPFWRRRHPPLA